jgi:hypothetical protein
MLRNHKKFVPENTTRGWMDSQDFCFQLESSWHVLFGEPAELPTSALVMDQLQEAGLLGEFAKEMEIRPKIEKNMFDNMPNISRAKEKKTKNA